MARPTEPKVRKIRSDLDKLLTKLQQLRSTTIDMTINPKGSDVEICKALKSANEDMVTAAEALRRADSTLQAPERLLANRRANR